MSRKICIVITARASYARIKTVLSAIEQSAQIELMLVLTASAIQTDYGELEKQIGEDGFTITAKVKCLAANESQKYAALTAGLATIRLSRLFEKLKPDMVVTIADRFETLATAMTASYMNIPLAHIQGGEVTGNIDEKVRHAVTKLADYHFTATDAASNRLIRLGEDLQKVFTTGCPAIDLALQIRKVKNPFPEIPYLMVLQHPVTTQPQSVTEHFDATFSAIRHLNYPTIWFLPNADPGRQAAVHRIQRFQFEEGGANIKIVDSLPPDQFLHLLNHAACLIGNSSAGIREASALGVPVVNIGERQSGRERGVNVIDVAHHPQHIQLAVLTQLKQGRYPPDNLYGFGQAGETIARLLATLPLTFDKKITY